MPAGQFRRPRPRRYTGTATGVGTAFAQVTFTTAPRQGWVHQVKVTVTSGPATQIKARLIEEDGGREIFSYPLTEAPLNAANGRLYYEIPTGENLILEVGTDDATDGTAISAELTLETL